MGNQNNVNASTYNDPMPSTDKTREYRVPITINNVCYESLTDAARKLKVSYGKLRKYFYLGYRDDALLAKSAMPPVESKTIQIGSMTYQSLRQASKQLGVSPSKISAGLEAGLPDDILVQFLEADCFAHAFYVDGKFFNNIKQAASHIGISFKRLRNFLDIKYQENPEKRTTCIYIVTPTEAAQLLEEAKHNYARAMPITILGQRYPSLAAAAKAFDIDSALLSVRLAKGLKDEELVKKTSRKKIDKSGKAIVINGIQYASILEASQKLGINYQTLSSRIKKEMSPEQIGSKEKIKTNAVSLEYDGIKYKSITEMCDKLGFSAAFFRRLQREHNLSRTEALQLAIQIRESKIIVFNGVEYRSFEDLCRAYNLNSTTVYARIGKGWDLEKALTVSSEEAIRSRNAKPVIFRNETFPTMKLCFEKYGVQRTHIRKLMKRGMSFEEAMEYAISHKMGGRG